MQAPLQIAFHNLECSDAIKALIEEKAAWLERYHDRITSCRVVVESPHRKHRQGNQYTVRIDLAIPRGDIVVRRELQLQNDSADLATAVRDAFEAARRQLEEHVRRHRDKAKVHEAPPHARVSRLFAQDGYGFLVTPDAREVYFHQHAVLNGGFGDLKVGTEVTFVEEEGDKGPQASTVRPIGRHNHA